MPDTGTLMLTHVNCSRLRFGVCPIMIALVLAAFLPRTRGDESADGGAEATLKGFRDRLTNSSGDREKLRGEILDFRLKHPGTAVAARASALLSRLRSPLDDLNATNVPALERFPAWQPKELVAVIGEHRGRHGAPVLCPDGKQVATSGLDGQLVLWDLAGGKRLRQWTFQENVANVAYASDSRHLAVALATGVIYVLRLAPAALTPR
jgi:WD40 repeat protein